MGGYGDVGGGTSKRSLQGFVPGSGSASDDLNEYNPLIRSRARALFISAPIATALIETLATNVIGSGLIPNSRIDFETLGMSRDEAKRWQEQAEREFFLWAHDPGGCDALGRDDFFTQQGIAFKSFCASGDVFGLFKQGEPSRMRPYGLRVQLVEADRAATPKAAKDAKFFAPGRADGKLDNGNMCYDGVEVDGDGKIAAYHFRSTHPNEFDTLPDEKTEWTRVEAETEGYLNAAHMLMPDRPEQLRGVSILAPVIELLLQFRRYTEAELKAALIQADIAAFVLQPDQDSLGNPLNGQPVNETGEAPAGRASQPWEQRMGDGVMLYGVAGSDVKFPATSHPAQKFGEFARTIAELIGASRGTPAGILLKSLNGSYSASRGEMLEFSKTVKIMRDAFAARWCKHVWDRIIAEAVARGRLRAPGFFRDPLARRAFTHSEWIGPTMGNVDPVKEVQALLMQIDNKLTTRENATSALGNGDFYDNLAQLARESELIDSMLGKQDV